MPGLNQRGPMGEGPITGREMGRCTRFGAAVTERDTANMNEENSGIFQGRGFGSGRGTRTRGRGIGRGSGMGRMNNYRGGF